MPYTIDPDTIRQSITELSDWSARDLEPDTRESATILTNLALFRPIFHTNTHQLFPKNLSPIETPRFQPVWIAKALKAGERIYGFDPSDRTIAQMTVVADWITRSLDKNADWLCDLDQNLRPKSLLAFSSLDQAAHHAKTNPPEPATVLKFPAERQKAADYRSALVSRTYQNTKTAAPEQDTRARDQERD